MRALANRGVSEPWGRADRICRRLARVFVLLRKAFPSRPPRKLRVSETLALGDKRQLLIVEYGDRQLLIGAAGNFVATLAELSSPQTQPQDEARS